MLNKNHIIFSNFLWVVAALIGFFRFDVGIDYMHYLSSISNYHIDGVIYFEYGNKLLIDLIKFFNLPDYMFISLLSISTLYLFRKFYYKADQKSFLFLTLFFIIYPGLYLTSFNIMRQYFSMAIFCFALLELGKKNNLKFFYYVLVASLFHVSALLFAPFYFFNKNYSMGISKINTLNKSIIFIVGLLFGTFLISFDGIKYNIDVNELSDYVSYSYQLILVAALYFLLALNKRHDNNHFFVIIKNFILYVLIMGFALLFIPFDIGVTHRLILFVYPLFPLAILNMYRFSIGFNAFKIFIILIITIYFIITLALKSPYLNLIPYHSILSYA